MMFLGHGEFIKLEFRVMFSFLVGHFSQTSQKMNLGISFDFHVLEGKNCDFIKHEFKIV